MAGFVVALCDDGRRHLLGRPSFSQILLSSGRSGCLSVRRDMFVFSVHRTGGLRDSICGDRFLFQRLLCPGNVETGFFVSFSRFFITVSGKCFHRSGGSVASACFSFVADAYGLQKILLKSRCENDRFAGSENQSLLTRFDVISVKIVFGREENFLSVF